MGIECAHIFVTKAEPCHHAWTELLDEDIGALNELGQFRAVHLVLEIEVHTDLAAIEHDESRAFAVDHRRKTPRILASGLFDLDYLRAGFSEHQGGQRPRKQGREVNDKKTGQRLHKCTLAKSRELRLLAGHLPRPAPLGAAFALL